MNITEKLDLAIKMHEIKTTAGAYVVPYNGKIRSKSAYMTNDEWKRFYSTMPSEVRKEYSEGAGDELSEKNGRPPKMASYGSSSRLLYMLSRDKKNFHYEKKLPTTVGGKANLDGFYEDAEHYIFVEAKCHEPYTMKTNVVSQCYAKLYEYINHRLPGDIHIEMSPNRDERYMNVVYFANGEKLEHFDMKQMICHLLGIATGMLNGTLTQKQTDFIYLLYDPTELDIDPTAKEQIDTIYERTCYECNLIDFAELLRVIFEYLMAERYGKSMTEADVNRIIGKFTFTLASQEFYPILIQ